MPKPPKDLWDISLKEAKETIQKSFVKDVKWNQLSDDDLLNMTVRELFERRFMIEAALAGNKVFICSHKEDLLSLRSKYPNNITIHYSQIIELFSQCPNQNSLKDIIKVLSVFKEASIKNKK